MIGPTVSSRVALYARVSTSHRGQDVGLQLDELRRVAAQRGWAIVAEHVDEGRSGADRARPALADALEAARLGHIDLLAIWKLDRLARDTRHLLDVVSHLEEYGVGLVSLRDSHIDTSTAQGRFSLQILSSVAELEKEMIRERVRAGLERARRRGVKLGRPPVPLDMRPVRAMLAQGHSIRETARALGVSGRTLRRRLVEAGEWPRPEGVQKSPGEDGA